LACTGTIDPNRMVRPSGGRVDDEIILTKPIGTGVVATALKAEKATPADMEAALDWMRRLNGPASRVMVEVGPHAATDVTGFGLLGHLSQMAEASGLAAEVIAASVPLLPGAFEYARRGFIPAGGLSNRDYFSESVSFSDATDEGTRALMHDPQTSGGLLIAVESDRAGKLMSGLAERGEHGWRIGRLTEGEPGQVVVR